MDLSPYRFPIAMPGHALIDLKQRLANTRWPDAPQANDLKNLVAYWQTEYRWHNVQAAMNKYTHYRVPMADTRIHFLYKKGIGPNPMPLILTHGWPGSFWDLHPIIGPLTDPVAFGGKAEDAFDVIIPSLPGLVFSSPTSTSISLHDFTADLWHTLMTDILGYTRYAASGVGWGASITQHLALRYPKSSITTYITPDANIAQAQPAGPRPHTPALQTWAYSLNDSPVALLAWLADRLPPGAQASEHLITNTMLYWLTGTAASATEYYEAGHEPWSYTGYRDRTDTMVHDIRTAFGNNR